MDAVLVIAFHVATAVLISRVRRFNLAVTAIVLTGLLVVALILQTTVSDRIGGYAALGLLAIVVMVGLAVQFGAWPGRDDDIDTR